MFLGIFPEVVHDMGGPRSNFSLFPGIPGMHLAVKNEARNPGGKFKDGTAVVS